MKRKKGAISELSGVLTDREKLWQAMRRLRTFTTSELALTAKVARRQTVIKDYVTSLVRAGILRRETQERPGVFASYELIRDTGVDAPRVRKDGAPLPETGQTRMWRAMKILKVFSARDLVVHASLPEAPVKESTAVTYCKWLERGGYLAVARGDKGDVTRYRFVKDTGARAPQVLSIGQLYDPNTGKVAAAKRAEDAYAREGGSL